MKKIERNEKLLIFGRWSSHIGNIIFDYANSISIVNLNKTNALLLAIYQSSETIIAVLFNLFGGAVADGNNRKKLLIITDLLSAVVCFIMSFFIESKLIAYVLIIANCLLAIISAFNSPAYKSIVREMINKDRIVSFNSISNAGSEVMSLVGPVIGLGLVNLVGVRGALIFNAITFLFSGMSEAMLSRLGDIEQKKHRNKNVFKDIYEGLTYLFNEKQALYLIILSALTNFFLAGYNLLVPYTNVIFEDTFYNFYSKVLIVEGIGGILGALLSSKLKNALEDRINLLLLIFGSSGVFLCLIPISRHINNLFVCLFPFLCFSIVVATFNIQFMSYIQVKVDESYLGRIFSIISTVAVLFMPLGSIFFSKICSVNNINTFYTIGFGIIALAVFSYLFIRSNQ